jgi:hypothetical protein
MLTFNRKGAKSGVNLDNRVYNQRYSGNAPKILISRNIAIPSDVDPGNIIAQGRNMSWSEDYQITPVIEWDTYFSQESVIGMQGMGSWSIGSYYTLRLADSLPTIRSLPFEGEMQMIQQLGKEHPNSGIVLNAWFGVRITRQGSGQDVNGLMMQDVSGIFRYRMSPKEWKLQNPISLYPGDVKEVEYGDGAVNTFV